MMKSWLPQNVVYVLQSGAAGPIKIGTARGARLMGHIEKLQCGNPEPLALRHLLDGDEDEERRVARLVAVHHLRGEWYAPEALDALRDAGLPFVAQDFADDVGGHVLRMHEAHLLADQIRRLT